MKLQMLAPAKSLSKACLRQSLKREQVELFKANLERLLDKVNERFIPFSVKAYRQT